MEIVASVRRVTEMDQTKQQKASLVEQAWAAALIMQEQAANLVGGGQRVQAGRPARR